jgi:hypothetical protein
MNIRDITWILQVSSFFSSWKQVEDGLNLLPVPIEISWRFLVFNLEETSVLHVHHGDNFLVTIGGNECSTKKVESLLVNTTGTSAEKSHDSQYLHLVILLGHFG